MIGRAAAFVTLTAPLVLLRRNADGEPGGLPRALSSAAGLGGGALLIAALFPRQIVVLLFGSRYSAVVAILGPYMLAMALLGISQVLAAHLCARGAGRLSIGVVAAAAVLQALLILRFGRDARSVSLSTLVATCALTLARRGGHGPGSGGASSQI